MIETVCLSHGALVLSRKQVIVKRISAIQNLGAMDVLCTDKTGTLTQDRVILERYCDVELRSDPEILRLAYLNSHFQTGLRSVLDQAVLAHTEQHSPGRIDEFFKVDEIPFDFQRRVMSVVVRTPEGIDRLICKGAPEAVFTRCTHYARDGEVQPFDQSHLKELRPEYERLSADGFRVLAIATRETAPRELPGREASAWSPHDEAGLTLRGYVAFLDPPKESAASALEALRRDGIEVKVLTGDNELVARKVCRDVGLPVPRTMLGSDMDALDPAELAERVRETTLFARVSPLHKQRIIEVLRAQGHVVGFLGDGINDAPALHAADLGISVDSAVDVAKATADMILLEKSLLVLSAGVIEGRKVFANILKYVRMGASSNFGNMLSVVRASALVPFLPMAPVQILANNLLYDLSQTAIPTDEVDVELIEKHPPMGPARIDAVHPRGRAVFFGVRLHHVPDALVLVRLCGGGYSRGTGTEPAGLPDRLVCGESADPDPDHPHHPDQQDTVSAEPFFVAFGGDVGMRGRSGPGAALHLAGNLPGVHGAPPGVLGIPGPDSAGLRPAYPGGEGLAVAAWLDLKVMDVGFSQLFRIARETGYKRPPRRCRAGRRNRCCDNRPGIPTAQFW